MYIKNRCWRVSNYIYKGGRFTANMAPAPGEEDLDLFDLHDVPALDCILDISPFLSDCGEYTIIHVCVRVFFLMSPGF